MPCPGELPVKGFFWIFSRETNEALDVAFAHQAAEVKR